MPLVKKLYIGEHGVLGVWKITETVDELLNLIHFSNGDKEVFDQFRNKSRQAHWLSYRLAIRHLLGELKEVEFVYDENGKIHFRNDDYKLSVSHSGDYAAVILHSKHQVGIDIERISDRISNITLKFLSVEELIKTGDQSDQKQLTCIWSAKEALYKLNGTRDLVFDKNIIVEPCFAGDLNGVLNGRIVKEGVSSEYELKYFLIDDYIVVYTIDYQRNTKDEDI